MNESAASAAGQVQRFGRYEVLMPVADDGFVTTCMARVRGPNVGPRIVELARIARALSHEAEVRAAFFAEARAAGRIRHVNFVHPTDTLVHEGDLFGATEFVLGVRLEELMQAARAAKLDIPLGVTGRIVLDVLAGLSAVHATSLPGTTARPLVHGDVAPTNIVMSYRGISRLVHSGLSVVASRIGAIDRRNRRLAYKAPEQLRAGVQAVPIGPGADLFAVGVILWELLAGERLFDACSDLETVERVLNAPVPAPRSRYGANIPSEVTTLVALALERRAERPTTSAADFGDALEQAIGSTLAGDQEVALLVDCLLGPTVERIREQMQTRLHQAESNSEELLGASDFTADVPPSSGTLVDRRKASSGRLRAHLQPRTGVHDAASRMRTGTQSVAPSSTSRLLDLSPPASKRVAHTSDGLEHAPASKRRRPRARLGLYIAMGAVIGLLAAAAWRGLSGDRPKPSPAPPFGETSTAGANTAASSSIDTSR
jgi:eukaryotic-like serine/threonine-protein kinase